MELLIGRVVKSHGIAGEVVVEVRTDDPEARFASGATFCIRARNGHQRRITIAAARQHGGRLLVQFTGVVDRDAADALRGSLLLVDSAELPLLAEPDTYYDHQLEGLRVRTTTGHDIGVVASVVHTAGGELLSVQRPSADTRPGAGELLVPFVSAIVTVVSLADQYLVIDPPDGLLDIDAI